MEGGRGLDEQPPMGRPRRWETEPQAALLMEQVKLMEPRRQQQEEGGGTDG